MNKLTINSADRISTIDGLRAIACLSVVLWHSRALPLDFPFDFGRFGVLLFFIISGYCIVLAFRSLKERPIKEFLIRRVFRLYPAYWMAIFLSIFIGFQEITLKLVIVNMTMFQTAFGVRDISGNFWTLFYELIFYIIVTIFLIQGIEKTKKSFAYLFVTLIILALVSAVLKVNNIASFRLPVHPIIWLSLFFYGGVIAVISTYAYIPDPISFFKKTEKNIGLFYTGLAIFFYFIIFHITRSIIEMAYWQFVVYLTAILLFFSFLYFKVTFPSILTYIGKISFSIYLVHDPCFLFLRNCGWFDAYRVNKTKLITISALIFSAILSVLIYNYVEKPMIDIGKKFARR